MGNYIGEFPEYDASNNSSFWKNYMRVKVKINVRLPLKRWRKISYKGGSGSIVSFKYERLPNLCFICGLLGHTKFFCPKLADFLEHQIRKECGSWLRVQNRRGVALGGESWLRDESYGDFLEAPGGGRGGECIG